MTYSGQVLDSNSEYLFGESVGLLSADGNSSAQAFHNALDTAQKGTILRLRLGKLMFAHRDSKYRQACADVHAYADQFVVKALEFRRQQALLGPEKDVEKLYGADKKKYVFLDELAKDTEDPIVLRDQIVNMLLAARDTTAGLISFVFFMLARDRRVWDKVRAEVLGCWTEPLTYDAVQEMTYLRYVLQESKSQNHRCISSGRFQTLITLRFYQHFACSLPLLPTAAWRTRIQQFLLVVALMETHRCSLRRTM